MCHVYILRSLKNNDLYVGSAEDLDVRLSRHNNGRVKSTKAYRPWELLEYEAYTTRSEAVQRERFLKTHQQKEILKKKYGHVAEWLRRGLQNPVHRFNSGRGLIK